ncbi:MAG: helix-turn-helix domain-containing protein [Campylobacterales bacterium]|nr:helix-turn-helix domain-containing protein [Campylobacterales bacterium]
MKTTILKELKKQKVALGISYEVIASHSGVGIATVKRAFSGQDISLERLEKIADAIGCQIGIKTTTSPKNLYNAQIEKKAQEIVRRVMQTSALEDQAVDIKAKAKMFAQAKEMISKMPRSQVWK